MSKKPKTRLEQILDPGNREFPDAGMTSHKRAAAQMEALLAEGIPISQRIFIAIFPLMDPGYMIKAWMKRGEIPAAKVNGRWVLSEDYCRGLIDNWRNDPLNFKKHAEAESAERAERPTPPSPRTRH
jgi:hypothetical protein